MKDEHDSGRPFRVDASRDVHRVSPQDAIDREQPRVVARWKFRRLHRIVAAKLENRNNENKQAAQNRIHASLIACAPRGAKLRAVSGKMR